MIESLTLERFSQNDTLTLGALFANISRQPRGVTLELPWRDNRHNISRIPPGSYHARRYASPKRSFAVLSIEEVPGREDIELHVGNFTHDTDGCILIGSSIGILVSGPASPGECAILGSRAAFDALMREISTEPIPFIVRDVFPVLG
jgi:hypothetical protein